MAELVAFKQIGDKETKHEYSYSETVSNGPKKRAKDKLFLGIFGITFLTSISVGVYVYEWSLRLEKLHNKTCIHTIPLAVGNYLMAEKSKTQLSMEYQKIKNLKIDSYLPAFKMIEPRTRPSSMVHEGFDNKTYLSLQEKHERRMTATEYDDEYRTPNITLEVFFKMMSEDIVESSLSILISVVLSLVLGLFLISIINKVILLLVWASLCCLALPPLAVGVYIFILSSSNKISYIIPPIYLNIEPRVQYIIVSMFILAIVLIYCIFIFQYRKKIEAGIKIIKECRKVMRTPMCYTIILVFSWTLQLVNGCYFIIIIILLLKVYINLQVYSAQYNCTIITNNSNKDVKTNDYLFDSLGNSHENAQVNFSSETLLRSFIVYTAFEYLWNIMFIEQLSNSMLSSSIALAYQRINNSKLPSEIYQAVHYTFRYHLGTVAVGSLIRLVVRAMKLGHLILISSLACKFFRYIKNKCQKDMKKGTFLGVWLDLGTHRLLKQAAIVAATNGRSFLKSISIVKNIMKKEIASYMKVTEILIIIIVVFVTTIICAASFFLIHWSYTNLNFGGFFPILIVFFLVFTVQYQVFSVCTVAAETVMVCYLNDLYEGDSSHKIINIPRDVMAALPENKYHSNEKCPSITGATSTFI